MYKKLLLATAVMGLTACGSSSSSDTTTTKDAEIGGELTYSIDEQSAETTGSLTIADIDDGEAAFIEQTDFQTDYGIFSITAEGAWTYTVTATPDETQTDTVSVTSIDGTEAFLVFTIEVADSDNPGDDDGDNPGDDDGDNPGDDDGDNPGDGDGDNTTAGSIYYKDAAITGSLTADSGQTFTVKTDNTVYGDFAITTAGDWTYAVEENETLGDMESDESVVETVIVLASDGSETTITLTIYSADAKPDDETDPDDGTTDPVDDDEDPSYACGDAWVDDGSDDASPIVTGETHTIDADDLNSTLAAAQAGDEIVITGGDSISIKDVCLGGQVLIRAETVGSITLETAAITRSQGITLQGFVFGPNDASTLVKVADSKNIKVLRNTFDHKDVADGQTSVVSTGNSEEIHIAYNEFLDKNVITEEATGESDSDGNPYYEINSGSYIKFQYDDDTGTMTKAAHVHHNYFKNIEAYVQTGSTTPEGDSDREAIVFGDSGSQDVVTNHLIEYNLFEDCDGENEIMTVKTSGNTFSHNTFLNSMGSLSFRLGHDNIAEYNYFYGTDADAGDETQYFYGTTIEKVANYQTGGVRIYGQDQIVRGNYMENLTGDTWRLPILVDSGDVSDSSNGNSHEAPTNALIEGNILVNNLNGGIQVGGSKYTIMPSGNTLNDNKVIGSTGYLYFSYAAGSANSWSGNTAYATTSAAIELDGADAGAGITLTDGELSIVSETTTTTLTPLTTDDVGIAAGL